MKNYAEVAPENNIFLPIEAKILKVKQATETERHFTLQLADKSKMKFDPGQILEVSLLGFGEIPIGLASSPTRENTFDLVIRTVGRVSTALNNLKDGDSLYVRGPLGHGFDLSIFRNNNVLVIAGGIGLCPTRSLVQYIMDRRSEFKHFTLFYGARNPSQQMFHDDLKQWREAKKDQIEFHEIVDKGDQTWSGHVGVITELFKKTSITPDTKVVICGPPIMFRFVIAELTKVRVPFENIFVDLERRMKCGVGKCGHCQINDKYVCIDGPVFCFAAIKGLEEAL